MRDNRAATIVNKVSSTLGHFSNRPSVPCIPYGASLATNSKGDVSDNFSGAVAVIKGNGSGYIRPDQIERNHAWIDQWKVLIPKAGDGHGRETAYVLGEPIAVGPGSVSTDTYLVAGRFDDRHAARNYASYLTTKFVRFLVLQRKVTQDLVPERFKFVPMLDSVAQLVR